MIYFYLEFACFDILWKFRNLRWKIIWGAEFRSGSIWLFVEIIYRRVILRIILNSRRLDREIFYRDNLGSAGISAELLNNDMAGESAVIFGITIGVLLMFQGKFIIQDCRAAFGGPDSISLEADDELIGGLTPPAFASAGVDKGRGKRIFKLRRHVFLLGLVLNTKFVGLLSPIFLECSGRMVLLLI